MLLGWFLMVLILSLDVMGTRDAISFCPAEENEQSSVSYSFNTVFTF